MKDVGVRRGRYMTFSSAELVCGACEKRETFSKRPYGPDQLAREAGWSIVWPGPTVRCPNHRPAADR